MSEIFSEYFILNDSPEDPRALPYRNGQCRQEFDYDKGELREARYYKMNMATGMEAVAVREDYTWRRKETGILYAGYDLSVRYYYQNELDGEDGISVERSFVLAAHDQFEQVKARLRRNLYALGAEIDDFLGNPAFFNLFIYAIDAELAYERAHCLPLIKFIKEAPDNPDLPPEAVALLETEMPNGKTIAENSISRILVDQCIDYWEAEQYLMRDGRRV